MTPQQIDDYRHAIAHWLAFGEQMAEAGQQHGYFSPHGWAYEKLRELSTELANNRDTHGVRFPRRGSMAKLIRIRQDLIISTDAVDRVFMGSVLLKDGSSFSITPPVWAAFQAAAGPPENVDVTPYEERTKEKEMPRPSFAELQAGPSAADIVEWAAARRDTPGG